MITLIVPAHLRDTAATLCETIAGPAGAGMFVTPLYSDSEPPSHYISTGWIADAFQQALPCTSVVEGELVTRPADYEALTAVAQAAGISVTQAELEGIFSQCDISDQPWRDAVARLGLSLQPTAQEDTV